MSRTNHALICLYYIREIMSFNAICLFSASLFHFVGAQIDSKVIVFGPAGPDIEPGRCTFLSALVS